MESVAFRSSLNTPVLRHALRTLLFPILWCTLPLQAQVTWWGITVDSSFTRMPVPLSNNAVVAYGEGMEKRAYSFGGIDSTRKWSGIRQNAYRFDVDSRSWTELAPMPDTLGKIASAASMVKGKIYVLGGYHVFSNGSELSSDRVHIFDPATDTWLPDGAPIPVPIDDHVQAVYKDSLIFVVTGWSNSTNVPDVQIYNPATDSWQVGTPVPNTSQYKVFGASGLFIGDTLVYLGGARIGFNFPLGGLLRKGNVDPSDPTQIVWSAEEDSLADRYRAAVSLDPGVGYAWITTSLDDRPLWFGGSRTSYNYNGIAYNGSGPVAPESGILALDDGTGMFRVDDDLQLGIMDLRGSADFPAISGDPWDPIVLLGGMRENQRVWGKALILQPFYQSLPNLEAGHLEIHPSITSGPVRIQPESVVAMGPAELIVVDIHGRIVLEQRVSPPANIDLSAQQPGIYHVVLSRDGQRWQGRVVVVR